MPVATTAAAMSAAVDIFVKIKGTKQGVIKGESMDSKHAGEIDAYSYTWDIVQPTDKGGSGLASGKRQLGVFKFLMDTQSATPKLFSAAASGEVLTEVTVTCRKAGKDQQEYLVWTLTNGMITRIDTGYLGHGDVTPHDQVSMTFRTITMTYKEQQASGTLGGAITFTDAWQI